MMKKVKELLMTDVFDSICCPIGVTGRSRRNGMSSIKIKELLMEAMINFAIAEKAGDHFASGYHMGNVHAYLTALGENARIYSPWHRLWRNVFTATL